MSDSEKTKPKSQIEEPGEEEKPYQYAFVILFDDNMERVKISKIDEDGDNLAPHLIDMAITQIYNNFRLAKQSKNMLQILTKDKIMIKVDGTEEIIEVPILKYLTMLQSKYIAEVQSGKIGTGKIIHPNFNHPPETN